MSPLTLLAAFINLEMLTDMATCFFIGPRWFMLFSRVATVQDNGNVRSIRLILLQSSMFSELIDLDLNEFTKRYLLIDLVVPFLILNDHQVALENDSEVPQMILAKFVKVLGVDFFQQVSFDEAETAIDRYRLIGLEILSHNFFDFLLRLQ
jgi:hypothetical protein